MLPHEIAQCNLDLLTQPIPIVRQRKSLPQLGIALRHPDLLTQGIPLVDQRKSHTVLSEGIARRNLDLLTQRVPIAHLALRFYSDHLQGIAPRKPDQNTQRMPPARLAPYCYSYLPNQGIAVRNPDLLIQ